MRDISGNAYSRLQRVSEQCSSYLGSHGFEPLDTPILEDTDLFVRKSGGELTSKLYSFVDPGGNRVSLRPEFTSSVIRHFIELEQAPELPARWYYNGPVFRHEPVGGMVYRQFTQVGAELIGTSSLDTEVEVLNLAVNTLRYVGMDDLCIRLGHIGVLGRLLSRYGISEAAKIFIVNSIPGIKSGVTDTGMLMEKATEMGLLRDGTDQVGVDRKLSSDNMDYIRSILSQAMSSPIGRRTSEDIISRLLRKSEVVDSPESLRASMEMVSKLVNTEGGPSEVFDQIEEIANSEGIDTNPLEELSRLIDRLDGIETNLTIDFGFARGISYYTGVVFEFSAPSPSGEILFGGGGRYDSLVKALGGDDVPALGFAISVEPLVDALDGPGVQHA